MSTLRYQREPLTVATGAAHVVELPTQVLCVGLTGLLFDSDKAFLLPGAMRGIRGLVGIYGAHPNLAAVVTGHTDRVGGDGYNLGLSHERAEAVAHFLRDEVDGWLAWYRGKPSSQPWATREDQHMLMAVHDGAGAPYYPGPVHGRADEPSRDAVRRFQADHGQPVTGTADEATRRALIRAYMALDGTSLPAGAQVELLGCGERHNAVPTADGVDEPANRRVEVFLFDPALVEPPTPPRCPGPGCPYEQWRRRADPRIDFDHDLCELLVEVVGAEDQRAEPLAEAAVSLTRAGFAPQTLTSDGRGLAWFRDLVPGRYTVRGEKPAYQPAVAEVEARPGGIADAPTTRANLVGGAPASTPAALGTPPVLLRLNTDVFRVRWVDEPAIAAAAREQAFTWTADRLEMRGNLGGGTKLVVDDDHDGVFRLPRNGATKGFVEGAHRTSPHLTLAKFRLREAAEVEVPPDAVKDLPVSTRLRTSVWAFHTPFIVRKQGADDLVLDDALIAQFKDARIDDLSLVSTIGWDETSPADAPRVKWFDYAPAGDLKNHHPVRGVAYLRRLLDAMHGGGRRRQVQVGWAVVDSAGATGAYSQRWTRFLARATTAQIDALADDAVGFFTRQGLDIDGIGFDFELNWLNSAKVFTDAERATQATNVARLYQRTAATLRARCRDGFVTYANAPFAKDGDNANAFMQVQPFALARDTPNLFARPMCFDQHTLPAADIRAGVACAVRKVGDNRGGELHPAQAQFGLFWAELDRGGELTPLIRDTLRPHRIGLMLYQFPKARVIDQVHGVVDNTPITDFFTKAKAWDLLLNPDEAEPGTPGSPLQVPADLRWDPGF